MKEGISKLGLSTFKLSLESWIKPVQRNWIWLETRDVARDKSLQFKLSQVFLAKIEESTLTEKSNTTPNPYNLTFSVSRTQSKLTEILTNKICGTFWRAKVAESKTEINKMLTPTDNHLRAPVLISSLNRTWFHWMQISAKDSQIIAGKWRS